ncbi:MAG TPA: GAF domain-containing sensor histidine kinase [Patescibacteria group bacterium]
MYYILSILLLIIAAFIYRNKLKSFFFNSFSLREISESIWRIEKVVLETTDFESATEKVVNIILDELGYLKLGYQVIVLTLLDEQKQELRRIAISQTESAKKFLKETPIPFRQIVIPLTASNNLSVVAMKERKRQITSHVSDVLIPALTKEWVEKFQDKLGIQTSIVYPVLAKDKILGTLVFSLDKPRNKISQNEWSILDYFVGAVGIALDNALLFKSLNETTQKLKLANEKLKELDKLKDDFMSITSHELRAPMTAIRGYISMAMAKDSGKLNDEQKLYLERASESTERLINLVTEFLNASRIEQGRVELNLSEFDVLDLARHVEEEIGPKITEKQVIMKIQNPKNMSFVFADRDKILEVLFNLVGNSLKFTPPKGNITVTTEEEGEFVKVSIVDSGKGLSREELPLLFKKFGRSEEYKTVLKSDKGSGLGLYICKLIVELHLGQIYAESRGVGKGSTFSFILPKAGSDLAKKLAKVAPKPQVVKPIEKTQLII